jgi:RNA polymerase sigma factor (TIGR02999 family)
VTRLLRAWGDGDEGALERLTPLVEAELRRLARGYMGRERKDHTLQPTALVNEAFIRLTDARQIRWEDRAHFLGISARLMRRVLVDHARAHGYQKRGGGVEHVTFDEALAASAASKRRPVGARSRIGDVGCRGRTEKSRHRAAILRWFER